MKVAVKITRNGNAAYVCIPRRVLDALRWRAGDPVILEMTDSDSIAVHPPRIADLRVAGVLGVLDPTMPEGMR